MLNQRTSTRFWYFVSSALIALNPDWQSQVAAVGTSHWTTHGYGRISWTHRNPKIYFAETFGYFRLKVTKLMQFSISAVISRNSSATWRGSSSRFVTANKSIIQSFPLIGVRVSPQCSNLCKLLSVSAYGFMTSTFLSEKQFFSEHAILILSHITFTSHVTSPQTELFVVSDYLCSAIHRFFFRETT